MTEPEISKYGTKRWKVNGRLHRLGAPAVVYPDGTEEWWNHGELHRDDGPAIEYINFAGRWAVRNKLMSFNDFVDYRFSTDSPEKTAFILKWAK